MNRLQMFNEVKFWVGLQDILAYDETQFINDKLYQGAIDLLARTKCTARCVQLRVSAGEDTYVLDHSILGLVDVEDGARYRARRDEPLVTDLPGVIIFPPGSVVDDQELMLPAPSFTLIRSDILRISPTPSADGTVQVWGVMKPAQMVADTDSPSMDQFGGIPDEYHDAIMLYALWKASDYSDDQGSQQGERYRVLYEGQDGRSGRIGTIKSLVNRRGTAKAPRSRVKLRGVNRRWVWVG